MFALFSASLTLYLSHKLRLIALKTRIGKFPNLILRRLIHFERALLQVRHFVKAIHIKLSNE